ncbi:acyl carrier protein [Geomonas limicola]|uniref:Acyl carrier protein n=1 Tax=Geomonas limicola TaxID=2740186 RepID=A0A6V8NCQ4_9BACT|nr:acyl carrier protein [Geomonas limicola]GFO69664.1 acyl carrier protein [Geomonas limicola]
MRLQEEIRQFIVDTFLFGEDGGLKDDSSFLEEGIVDSTGILQLVSFLQDRYLISIEDAELIPDNLDSIGKVSAFVRNKRGTFDFEQEAAQALVPEPA